jgi:hypothetical protein
MKLDGKLCGIFYIEKIVRLLLTESTLVSTTERFKNVKEAEYEGYHLQFGCVTGFDNGAMGLHYVNMDLVGKNKVNPYAPQIVIYEPTPKGPKLIELDGGLCGSNQMLVGSSKRFRTVLLLDHFSADLSGFHSHPWMEHFCPHSRI